MIFRKIAGNVGERRKRGQQRSRKWERDNFANNFDCRNRLFNREKPPQIAPLYNLIRYLKTPNSSFITQDLTTEISQTLTQIPRSVVPDMPDRIIAATALHLNLPLVTKDGKIRALRSIQTIW